MTPLKLASLYRVVKRLGSKKALLLSVNFDARDFLIETIQVHQNMLILLPKLSKMKKSSKKPDQNP